MAAFDSDMRYASDQVYGSLAYNIAAMPKYAPEPEYEPEYTPDIGTIESPETDVNERTRVRLNTRTRAKASVSPLAIFGFAFAGVLLVLVLLSYVTLTKLSDTSVQLKREIAELEETQTKLKVQYESVFDLSAIEEYAVGTLGMVKADSSQISYLDSGSEDKAVILSENEGSLKDAFASVREFFASIKESLS